MQAKAIAMATPLTRVVCSYTLIKLLKVLLCFSHFTSCFNLKGLASHLIPDPALPVFVFSRLLDHLSTNLPLCNRLSSSSL